MERNKGSGEERGSEERVVGGGFNPGAALSLKHWQRVWGGTDLYGRNLSCNHDNSMCSFIVACQMLVSQFLQHQKDQGTPPPPPPEHQPPPPPEAPDLWGNHEKTHTQTPHRTFPQVQDGCKFWPLKARLHRVSVHVSSRERMSLAISVSG